ncbi:hypothetical protein A0H81_14621 [Grifola frondosa]|uniref:Uncharacterized protein n=1 Tax=Grifola frondosa TaxID=5627 RepID=A0A1C7LKY0_GRIFR|nr:hypothetical protein A0H81_14621 [Grifola frondosa]
MFISNFQLTRRRHGDSGERGRGDSRSALTRRKHGDSVTVAIAVPGLEMRRYDFSRKRSSLGSLLVCFKYENQLSSACV